MSEQLKLITLWKQNVFKLPKIIVVECRLRSRFQSIVVILIERWERNVYLLEENVGKRMPRPVTRPVSPGHSVWCLTGRTSANHLIRLTYCYAIFFTNNALMRCRVRPPVLLRVLESKDPLPNTSATTNGASACFRF